MCDYIKKLQSELQGISKRIYPIKELINSTDDPDKVWELESKLRRLQFQALFYFDKIENLR